MKTEFNIGEYPILSQKAKNDNTTIYLLFKGINPEDTWFIRPWGQKKAFKLRKQSDKALYLPIDTKHIKRFIGKRGFSRGLEQGAIIFKSPEALENVTRINKTEFSGGMQSNQKRLKIYSNDDTQNPIAEYDDHQYFWVAGHSIRYDLVEMDKLPRKGANANTSSMTQSNPALSQTQSPITTLSNFPIPVLDYSSKVLENQHWQIRIVLKDERPIPKGHAIYRLGSGATHAYKFKKHVDEKNGRPDVWTCFCSEKSAKELEKQLSGSSDSNKHTLFIYPAKPGTSPKIENNRYIEMRISDTRTNNCINSDDIAEVQIVPHVQLRESAELGKQVTTNQSSQPFFKKPSSSSSPSSTLSKLPIPTLPKKRFGPNDQVRLLCEQPIPKHFSLYLYYKTSRVEYAFKLIRGADIGSAKHPNIWGIYFNKSSAKKIHNRYDEGPKNPEGCTLEIFALKFESLPDRINMKTFNNNNDLKEVVHACRELNTITDDKIKEVQILSNKELKQAAEQSNQTAQAPRPRSNPSS